MADRAKEMSERLRPLVGEWALEMVPPGGESYGDVGARVTFEWLPPGELWLIQRWSVPVPEAPDGIAMIGWDEGRGTLLQHYFDTRGVARVYEMTLENGVWTLQRTKEDFSPYDFAQRYEGRFNDDGTRIDGAWLMAKDKRNYEKDFDLNYLRVS
jgi:hypothetical protein